MKSSLIYKINLAILVTFCSIAAIFTAIEFPFQKQRFNSSLDRIELILQTLVERDREPLANEIFDKNIRAMKIRLKAIMKIKGMCAIKIFNSSGHLLLSEGIKSDPQDTIMAMTVNKTISQKPVIEQKRWHGISTLQYSQEISIIGERIGFIKIYYSIKDVEKEQKSSFLIFASLLCSILLIMLVVLNLMLFRMIIRPITFLRNAMEQMGKKSINQQIDIQTEDEIGDLAKTFNRMTLELAHSHEEIKTQNQELRDNKAKIERARLYLKNVLDSMPSALVGVDNHGMVTHWNRAAEKMTGITAKNAENYLLRNILSQTGHPDKILDRSIKIIDQAVKLKSLHKKTKIAGKINDQQCFFDLTIYPLDGGDLNGDLNDAVIRIDDVTEHVRMEETMIQSEKMLSVGGLAAGMAHEINNPLAGVLQNTAVIKNRLENSDLPVNQRDAEAVGTDMATIIAFMEKREIFRLLANVQKAGSRAAEIVKDMLGFARKGDDSFSSHCLDKLLDETVNLAGTDYNLKKKFDFRQIKIVKEYEPNLPAILCEKSKIQQVFFNILQNGAQAMAERQESRNFEPAQFILRAKQKGDRIQVEIEDNGPGMDKKKSKKIFEPFFTTKPVGIGTGLGLSIAYFIINDNHKGSITVDSTPGKGTKFIIQLPINR
ncbi:MAG: ATP-binding protein [Thermodesulfobacteriota bacterium]|nr:ATP-binding protein [Thermodesulfobacteriota bacterium]